MINGLKVKLLNVKADRELITNQNLLKAILCLSIPIVINNFIQTMYNLTDAYWLGRIGTESVAAITLVSPVQNVIIQFGQGISLAGSVLISQYYGAKDNKNAGDMANHVFICSMLFSLAAAFICFIATAFIVGWLGAEGDLADSAQVYLKIVVLDMPFLFLINLYSAVNQAQGNTVTPMLLNFLGIVLNMILDPLLMFGLNLGIAGAALATLSAKIPPAVIALLGLVSRNKTIHIDFKGFVFKKDKLKAIIKVGLPTALGGSTMQFGFLLITKNVLKYGGAATAAYGIGNRINGIITLPSTAVGSATATIVGQNIGAKKRDRAEEAYKLARLISVVFLFICGMILSRTFVNTPIVKFFSDDEEVIAMASNFISIMAFWCFTNGVYNSTTGLFQGSGHTWVNMAVDASRLWIFRFATIWFCENILHMREQSIWYAVVVSNGISAALLYLAYKAGLWKKDVIQKEE
ncbi:MAG: MATE family efflux transporter [Clostridiales bacterium]|nr:MATE family efflux transporter [Clostridiales bacterium]